MTQTKAQRIYGDALRWLKLLHLIAHRVQIKMKPYSIHRTMDWWGLEQETTSNCESVETITFNSSWNTWTSTILVKLFGPCFQSHPGWHSPHSASSRTGTALGLWFTNQHWIDRGNQSGKWLGPRGLSTVERNKIGRYQCRCCAPQEFRRILTMDSYSSGVISKKYSAIFSCRENYWFWTIKLKQGCTVISYCNGTFYSSMAASFNSILAKRFVSLLGVDKPLHLRDMCTSLKQHSKSTSYFPVRLRNDWEKTCSYATMDVGTCDYQKNRL